MLEALASSLTPEKTLELAREALAARLANSSISDLLGLTDVAAVVAPSRGMAKPHSIAKPWSPREPKDYLDGIVDVTVVSKDIVKSNLARIILKDAAGRSFLWDATSAAGLALEPGQKKRITATRLNVREGGHEKISRVRFYDKSAKPPVRFTR